MVVGRCLFGLCVTSRSRWNLRKQDGIHDWLPRARATLSVSGSTLISSRNKVGCVLVLGLVRFDGSIDRAGVWGDDARCGS